MMLERSGRMLAGCYKLPRTAQRGAKAQPRAGGWCHRHSLCPSPQEFPLAALAGTTCRCGFPSTLFPLHEREDEQLCAHKCAAEEFESCGSADFLLVYQTQVQGELFPEPFLPEECQHPIKN